MEAPRARLIVADRPGTGPGSFRSTASPARVSRLAESKENSRLATVVQGESSRVRYVAQERVQVFQGVLEPGNSLDPRSRLGEWKEKTLPTKNGEARTIFPAPRLSKAGGSPTAASQSYLIQPPCASMSPKGQAAQVIGSPKEAFGALDGQAKAGYSLRLPRSTPEEAVGDKGYVLGDSPKRVGYVIQAPSLSSKQSFESPRKALGPLDSAEAREEVTKTTKVIGIPLARSADVDSPKASISPQAKSFFRCPECDQMVSSIDEALKHCQGSPVPLLPSGEPVALDEHGRALIVRVTQSSGERETVVRLPDGQQRTFDASSVKKITLASETENTKFLEDLSHTELRGLVHEVGQRLLEGSQLYHSRLAELDRLGELANWKYFDLDEKATERELDNAYRKLAKKMHPDKNGGTDAAKQRFQAMKERYEALKKKMEERGGDPKSEGEDGEETEEKKEKEESKADEGKSNEYDPSKKESMVSTVVRMAGQLKNIDVQMVILVKELARASRNPEGI